MHHGATQTPPLDALLGTHVARIEAATGWATSAFADAAQVDRGLWTAAGEFGLFSLLVPEADGGGGASFVDTLLTFEGLGAAEVSQGIVFAMASQAVTTTRAIARFGSAEQQAMWLRPLETGALFGCFAMTEPGAGSGIENLETTATEQADGSYRLSGTKSWITLAPVADVALVFASTNPEVGRWGISAFVVDLTSAGVTRSDPLEMQGLAGCPWGELRFDNVEVGADAVVGRLGAGASIFSEIVDAERVLLYGPTIGTAGRLIEQTVEHARHRHQDGRHIGAHQAVSHRIVDMAMQHQVARQLCYRAAAMADAGESIALAGAFAKIAATDLGPSIALDALRTRGASGFAADAGLLTALADSAGGFSFSATADIARNIAAAQLGLDRPSRSDR